MFEADYYECSAFWTHGMVEDASNLKRIDATVRLIPEDARSLIDVGCGNGVFARVAKERFPSIRITCVDRSSAALEHVQADEKMRCEVVDLPFADRSFDCVSCLEVIEHLTVDDYKKALSELTRIAKATVIISVPYDEDIEKNVDRCPQCRTVFNRDLHLRSYDDATFVDLLSDFGFRMQESSIPVINTHYVGFRTYYKLLRMLKGVPDQSTLFLSPICPLCGYTPENDEQAPANPASPLPRPVRGSASTSRRTGALKRLVKRCWPKYSTPGYWIVGRFVRS